MGYFNGYFGQGGGGTVVNLAPITAVGFALPDVRRGNTISFDIPNLPALGGADKILFVVKEARYYAGRPDDSAEYSIEYTPTSTQLLRLRKDGSPTQFAAPSEGQTGSLELPDDNTLRVRLSAKASAALRAMDIVADIQLHTGDAVQTIPGFTGLIVADVARAT